MTLKTNPVSKLLLFLSFILGIAYLYLSYETLPEYVAIHFGAGGKADNWSQSGLFLLIGTLIYGFTNLLWFSMSFILRKFPSGLINIPKKDYWLAPERKDRSVIIFEPWFNIIGILTNLLLLSTFWLVIKANTSDAGKPVLDTSLFFPILSVYILAIVIWIIFFNRKFNRIPLEG